MRNLCARQRRTRRYSDELLRYSCQTPYVKYPEERLQENNFPTEKRNWPGSASVNRRYTTAAPVRTGKSYRGVELADFRSQMVELD